MYYNNLVYKINYLYLQWSSNPKYVFIVKI